MLKNSMRTTILLAGILLLTAVGTAQDKQSVFYFGSKRVLVGMPKAEAVAALSACCKLSPPAEEENRQVFADIGRLPAHFILSKDEQRILGSISFLGGKVVSVSRPLGEEEYAPWNEDVVGFARALYRAMSPTTGESDATVYLSVRHERASNAETEVLSLSFPNGRGIRLNIIRLDKPLPGQPTESRDQVTMDEFLEPSR